MNGNRYEIDPETNAIYRIPPRQRVAGAEKILEAMAQTMGCVVNGAFQCELGRTVRLACKREYVVMSTPIAYLNLKTSFSVRGEFLVPEFEVRADTINLDLRWTAPPNVNIYLAVKALSTPWRPHHACLFVRIDGQNGNWRLPIANTYADGRICLGSAYGDVRKNSLQELMQESLNLLDGATWNSDLYEDGWRITNSQSMFRFKTSDRTPVYANNPHALCVRVNSTTIEESL